MKETRKLIEQMFLDQIDLLWKDIKQPTGMIADIPDKTHADCEFGDVERYFSGKEHHEVEAFNDVTKYMPNPLIWMNNESSLYFSQCYLRNFILKYNDYDSEDSEMMEMCLDYFIKEFKYIKRVNDEQIVLAKRIIRYIKPVLDEQFNICLKY